MMNLTEQEIKMIEIFRRHNISPEEVIISMEDKLYKPVDIISQMQKETEGYDEKTTLNHIYNSKLKKFLDYSVDRYNNKFYKSSEKC